MSVLLLAALAVLTLVTARKANAATPAADANGALPPPAAQTAQSQPPAHEGQATAHPAGPPAQSPAADANTTQPLVAPWQKETVYQIYPRSFADGNADGIGDLRGILDKVDYLHDLGIDMVWLCPVNRTTNYDNGYDVSDYLDIDPTFGTLADWEALRDALHQRGIKIMMDLVLNHSSDAHPWFLQEMRLKAFETRLPKEPPTDFPGGPTTFAPAMQAVLRSAPLPQGVDPNHPLVHMLEGGVQELGKASVRATELGYPPIREQMERLAVRYYGSDVERAAAAQKNYDFYVWRPQPNNWTAVFSGSAWHLVESSGLYYLALFSMHQPDLNWNNPAVRSVMVDIMKTWIDRGVDGFRLDSVGFIAKDQRFLDAPASDTALQGRGMRYFINQPKAHDYLHELHARALAGEHLRTVGEVSFTSADAALSYAGAQRQELSEVFLFEHMYVDIEHDKWNGIPLSLPHLKEVIRHQQDVIHGRAWIANYLENHDQLRAVSRFGNDGRYRAESAMLLGTLLFGLEGTPYVYQGQEIGMTNGRFTRIEEIDDIEARNYYNLSIAAGVPESKVMHQVAARNRDNVRTVMQWDDSENGGFSTHTPWIKINSNYTKVNVKAEQADPGSVLNYYKKLVKMRKQWDVLSVGAYHDLLPKDAHLYVFTRHFGAQTALIMLNFSDQKRDVPIDLRNIVGKSPTLLLGNYAPADNADATAKHIKLQPWEARIYTNIAAPQPL